MRDSGLDSRFGIRDRDSGFAIPDQGSAMSDPIAKYLRGELIHSPPATPCVGYPAPL